jgi:beta-lactamase superfamily II metal-dependent hydrolase
MMKAGAAGAARALAPKALKRAPKKAPGEDAIRIRMYRVGFGDCFLISVPVKKGWEHILVDCGVHTKGNIGTIQAAVDNIFEETRGELALVIATHSHQDHISGFGACEESFLKFKVGEVWMPWTENPKDVSAVKLKNKQMALTESVAQHFAARPPSPEAKVAVEAALQNLRGNDKALRLLKSGINGGTVRYIEAGKSLDDVAGIQGLSVRFLGPPRDEAFLARMDPPKDERFFRLGAGGEIDAVNPVIPFEDKWQAEANSSAYYAAIDERDKNLLAVAATNVEGLAFALDRAMNNTSVVALFSYGGKSLLFPGDAQYGSWESWIDKADTGALLADVNFYKVAHHGSHNATPKTAVDKMTDKAFAAMVSTQSEPWESIPQLKLIDALSAKASAVMRSDSIKVQGAPEGPVVARVAEGFKRGKLWFDYFLTVKAAKVRSA